MRLRRRLARLAAATGGAAALACATHAPPPRPPSLGSVRGQVAPARDAASAPSEPLLVFLEPLHATSTPANPAPPSVLRSGEHGLEPAVLAVPAGASIRFANQSAIYHRIFSYSESNRFDLGVVRRGESRAIELRHPGVVRVYCSLHPEERAVVFVAPSPYFATFRPPAPYEIREVPPGDYRLHAWSENGAAAGPALTVPPGTSVAAELARLPAAAE